MEEGRMTAIGVDTHKDSLAACAVDDLGVVLAERTFANDRRGHVEFARWAADLVPAARIGVEGSASYGSALARHLVAGGHEVLEVPPQLSRRERHRTRRPGKSDPLDALAIARVVLTEPDLPPVRLADASRDLQLLSEARDALIAEQTRTRNRLHAHLVALVPGYGATIEQLVHERQLVAARRLLRGSRGVEAELARERLATVLVLGRRIRALEVRLRALVGDDPLLAIPGLGVLTAAAIRGEVGDPHRFRSDDALAMFAGVAPLPASSGRVQRVRLNRRGNRRLNRAIWTVAVWQSRFDERGRAYVARRRTEGKSWREAIRCLKRLLVRPILEALQALVPVPTGRA
jgi:transposase